VFSRDTKVAVTDCGWSRHECMVNNDEYTISNGECAQFHFVYRLLNKNAGASCLTVTNSSTAKVRVSLIFSCETQDNSSQVQTNSYDQNDIMRLAKLSQKEGVFIIILQRHNLRVLVLRTLRKEYLSISLPTREKTPC
jgi:hypothetical protein